VRADRRDLASNRVLRTRGWRPLPEAPGSLIHLSRVPLLTGLVAAPPRTPQRNRNELGETTVNRKRRKPMSQQENQQLRRCSLRSGRRGRRFESCHSDHLSCHSFCWLFLIAGGSRVNRRFVIRNRHKPAFSRRVASEACQNLVPRKRREQGMPGARCTRGLVCNEYAKRRTRAYRYSRNTPALPAQWFYGLCRALSGDEFVLPPSLPACWLIDPVGPNSPPTAWHQPRVSRPHGFAVRVSAVRLARRSITHGQAALQSRSRPTPPRPPHPIPRS
jgi:hypothetical protein